MEGGKYPRQQRASKTKKFHTLRWNELPAAYLWEWRLWLSTSWCNYSLFRSSWRYRDSPDVRRAGGCGGLRCGHHWGVAQCTVPWEKTQSQRTLEHRSRRRLRPPKIGKEKHDYFLTNPSPVKCIHIPRNSRVQKWTSPGSSRWPAPLGGGCWRTGQTWWGWHRPPPSRRGSPGRGRGQWALRPTWSWSRRSATTSYPPGPGKGWLCRRPRTPPRTVS